MISLARIVPLISSTRPLECTIRITSRAPHGRMQEIQHLMVFFMASNLCVILSLSLSLSLRVFLFERENKKGELCRN
jgi:hypothetical protein